MGTVIAYVVSGTIAAGAVTPVDTVTHIAGSPIVIGGGAITPSACCGSRVLLSLAVQTSSDRSWRC